MPSPGVIALAQHAYPFMRASQLQRQSITYSVLVGNFYGNFAGTDPQSQVLAAALGHICDRCHAVGLPALSSIVVTAATGRPGQGYYPAAHGVPETDPSAIPSWRAEYAAAMAATYPPSLP